MGTLAESVPESKIWWGVAVIVAMVGTGPDSFDRLVRPLDELAGRHGWNVFIQLGYTRYQPRYCRFECFVERDPLMAMIKSAELIITQGGYGGIRDALLYDKPILAVPRYPELQESPDHQDEMVRAMEEKGYLIGLYDIEGLEDAIQRTLRFHPEPRPASRIPAMLANYIESLSK
jgi:UDP-N-acetylglucosamine transferase subunit ALG13